MPLDDSHSSSTRYHLQTDRSVNAFLLSLLNNEPTTGSTRQGMAHLHLPSSTPTIGTPEAKHLLATIATSPF